MVAASLYLIGAFDISHDPVTESVYSYQFPPNASVTIPYDTYWEVEPAETGPYHWFYEKPAVNTTCLDRTLPDKFTINRYQKNGRLQRLEIVNPYTVPVELGKYRIHTCLSKHGTVRTAGDSQ